MKSMCAPAIASRMSSTAASAASRPLFRLASAPSPLVPRLNGLVRAAARQGLCIGVRAHELHALHAALDHVGDGVAAASATPTL